MQSYLRPRHVTCIWRNDADDTITGDSNGTIYVWGQGKNVITNLIKHAHSVRTRRPQNLYYAAHASCVDMYEGCSKTIASEGVTL